MKQNEIETIVNKLDKLDDIDLAELVAKHLQGKDLNSFQVGSLVAGEIPAISTRMSEQLRSEIEMNGRFLPVNYMDGNAVKDLPAQLDSYINSIQRNITNAVELLLDMIRYQLRFGFWDKTAAESRVLDAEDIRIEVSVLESKSAQFSQTLDGLVAKSSELEQAIESKKSQLTEIANAVESVRNDQIQIQEMKTHASSSAASIETNKDATGTTITELKEELGSAQSTNETLVDALSRAESRLQALESDANLVEEKKDFILKMTGLAASAGLGGKFEERRKVLSKASKGWLGLLIVSIVSSGLWVSYAFTTLKIEHTNEWLALASNFGLLLPAVFLLGFVASQYRKARATEEEYAFRSAVSMTLAAFADQLGEVGAETNPKSELIRQTVEKLYDQPKFLQ